MASRDSLSDLTQSLREFAADREWDQFHTPVHLSAALSIEAAELQEHFLWNTTDEAINLPEDRKKKVSEEIGDVLLYLIRLADKLGIDPVEAAKGKLQINAAKYPVDKARGNHKKYTEF